MSLDGSEARVLIVGEPDIVVARQKARAAAKAMGFGMVDQSRIATAVSELARNVVRYATNGRGEVIVRAIQDPKHGRGIEVVVRDQGPGIANVEDALRDGFTTGTGLGMGLPGARRLMDELIVDSALGRGTVVTTHKWRR
ncbi:MAG TPA: ATP-binding protein [Chloroflexota bacterium]|nr:ATP-binding protein [Chloroflexota bacterium]